MQIITSGQAWDLSQYFNGVDFQAANHRDTPPTMEEYRVMRLIMECYLLLFYDSPEECPEPPRMTWMAMLGADHDALIAAGMAAVWP